MATLLKKLLERNPFKKRVDRKTQQENMTA